MTIKDVANNYLQKSENAVSATSAVTLSNCTGNAENFTRLATPRKINVTDATELNFGTHTNFDGTENILMSDTVIVNRLGDGVIYDSSVATALNADSEITISAISTGNTTILINVAEGKNYLSASVTLPVECFVGGMYS